MPPNLTTEQERLLKLAEAKATDKDVLLFDTLDELKDTLTSILVVLNTIKDKETPHLPDFPEIPPTDLSEVTSLLQKLLEKKEEPVEITLELT